MKSQRQMMILDLITREKIETQEALAEALAENGYRVTQATVSRDIKELRLVKALSADGTYCYAQAAGSDRSTGERLARILRESMLSVVAAENLLVVKTISGSANVAAEALDSLGWTKILGSVAGDNTVLLVSRNAADAQAVADRLRELMS